MLFGKFRILGKLALLVLVPLLGVVGLSIPVIYERIDAARSAQDISNTVALATEVSSALTELQEERLLAVGFLLGQVDRPTYVVQSSEAIESLASLSSLDDMPQALRRTVSGAAKLNVTRQNVLNNAVANIAAVVEDYNEVITPLIDGLGLATSADLTTGVGRQVYALERAMRSDDLIGQAGCYLAAAVVAGRDPQAASLLLSAFSATFSQIESIITSSKVYFTDAQYKLYINTQDAFASRVGDEFQTALSTNPTQALKGLDISTLFPSLQSVTVLGSFVEKRVAKDVDIITNTNRESALRQAFLIGGGSFLLLILVITLSIFMARAVARPLRRLTVSADRIARAAEAELERVADDEGEAQVRPIRLDAVDVEARDEIGDLARAFDRVQTTAARLVERQVVGRRNVAQMFGHVGRRTQNLVGRQLSLIDSLERKETDSDRLRELYRLDHMSSRLRRNASALVVLSGGAGANEHMAPLALSDVVRLALGEIEDYTRVEVDVPEDIVVVPAVLADLTLLLAELLENSTAFSPPHTSVTVSAEELRGGARLAIIDHGLGLAPERLAEENARLTRRERLDLAPTEVLGLFVVGRLARRHGIEVTLTDTPDGGLTAWVDLNPSHLISRVENLTMAPAPAFPAPAAAPQIQAPEYQNVPAAPAYSGALRSNTTEMAITSAGGRQVPGSAQPFDPVVLTRATATLETGNSWNAFAPQPAEAAQSGQFAPAAQAADPYAGQPVYDAEPIYTPGIAYQEPVAPVHAEPIPTYDMGTPVAGRVPAALPALPSAPSAGPAWNTEPPTQPSWNETQPSWSEAQPAWNAPVPAVEAPMASAIPPQAPQLPQQRNVDNFHNAPAPSSEPARNGNGNGNGTPLRRRVPGSQLPAESAPQQHAKAPSQDDALAARAAFDAFEAGVSQAQFDTSVSMPAPEVSQPQLSQPQLGQPQYGQPNFDQPQFGQQPSYGSQPQFNGQPEWNTPAPSWDTPAPAAASPSWNAPVADPAPPAPPTTPGSTPLTRRVPGATLPDDEPHRPTPPPAPAQLDPDAARALMDQFEYGVALALNESQPQHEGQPR
ncbi:signal transduction histidine kinase [Actinoplanes lutulentus]|uniref:histidine kinase n=1 Tax=Actinoplanes lutulentus TaxID=1287878 RepID=A0A327Z841_9ACTN|nr:nitrate- and nitrite sensing domain-containing protein [Actinoplanes lutulentus]MBB2945624.1 signal transduction histidine kinase [Actinoplanes lutulentus]RAK27222.1 signal transduction histidine kinase [Actinoplanes lutulentus]